jgi:hypothetical protein
MVFGNFLGKYYKYEFVRCQDIRFWTCNDGLEEMFGRF